MKNIALDIAFDGTKYSGWQLQKDRETVSGQLCKALKAVTGQDINPTGCGRTDKGVHAKYYRANFYTNSNVPVKRYPLALNHYLPEDVRVTAACEVPQIFHSRASCVKKEYTYLVYQSRVDDPFMLNRAHRVHFELDLAKLKQAAAELEGAHDFEPFRSTGSTNIKSTVRTVHYVKVSQKGNLTRIKICANGFLYNMARIMAGTLIMICKKDLPAGYITNIFKQNNRDLAGPTAPAHGLYMTKLWFKKSHVTMPDVE